MFPNDGNPLHAPWFLEGVFNARRDGMIMSWSEDRGTHDGHVLRTFLQWTMEPCMVELLTFSWQMTSMQMYVVSNLFRNVPSMEHLGMILTYLVVFESQHSSGIVDIHARASQTPTSIFRDQQMIEFVEHQIRIPVPVHIVILNSPTPLWVPNVNSSPNIHHDFWI